MQLELDLKCILIIDELTRKKIKNSLSELSTYDVKIFSTLDDIDTDIFSKYQNIFVFEDYIKSNGALSQMKIYSTLFSIKFIFLSNSYVWINLLKDVATCYSFDVTYLDYDKLYSIIYKDSEQYNKYITPVNSDILTIEEIDRKIEQVSDVKVRDMLVDYKQLLLTTTDKFDNSNDYESIIAGLQRSVLSLEIVKEKTLAGYKDLLNRVLVQNDKLLEFESIFTQDFYHKVSVNSYDNRPIILYFKEYESMIHFQSFIETLFSAINFHNKLSCKVLILQDSQQTLRLKTYPEHYTILRNKFLLSDVLSKDFLVKYGDYSKVLEVLLTNKIKLQVLLVFDCKSYNDVVLSGSNVYFNICRNSKNLESFGLAQESTIVNNDNTCLLSWDTYLELKNFDTENEKFLFQSSRPVIQRILETLRVYSKLT